MVLNPKVWEANEADRWIKAATHGANAGVRTVIGPARTPGSVLLTVLFATSCVGLFGIVAIERVLRVASSPTVITQSVYGWLQALVLLFSALLGLYFVWQRKAEWRVLSLLGGRQSYRIVSTTVEVLVRCAVATLIAVAATTTMFLIAAWSVRTAFGFSLQVSLIPTLVQLAMLTVMATGAAVVATVLLLFR